VPDRLSGLRAHGADRATFGAGTRLAAVSRALDGAGLAMHNAPDIDSQTLAGAIATGTHGTAVALHADVLALTLLTPGGQRIECSRTQRAEVFQAARVSLGALGLVTELKLRVRPRHLLHRRARLLPLAATGEPALARPQCHSDAPRRGSQRQLRGAVPTTLIDECPGDGSRVT
jgi:FAD/FMN-containing dehydrogenase